MFREMRRLKQEISREKCIDILKKEPRGILSVVGDEGYPYGMPLNHWYCEEDGNLYFHCAKVGHKIDSIEKYDKVSYCVHDEGYREDGEWALNINSVIVFGKISKVSDYDKTIEICRNLTYKFTDDEEYIEEELRKFSKAVLCLKLTPVHMTGKLVKES